MKKLLTIVLCAAVAVLAGCSGKKDPEVEAPIREVDYPQLQDRNGIAYLPNEEKPFTGVENRRYENGQKKYEATLKDGKLSGLIHWHPNGQKAMEAIFKDGKKEGLMTSWYENGQKHWEATYKDNKIVSAIVWKPNGEKCPDTNVVDGNGIQYAYHGNGQKHIEETFKDGKEISAKFWDKDGNPID